MTTRVFDVDGRRLILNHVDEVIWKDEGFTKGDLVDFYLDMADHILPFLAGRPVSVLKTPDPVTGECTYQRTAPPGLPSWIVTRRLRSEHAALGYAPVRHRLARDLGRRRAAP